MWWELPAMSETISPKNVFDLYLDFLIWSMSHSMEEAGFMTYTVAGHQGAIRTLWLYFMSAIFIYSLAFMVYFIQINFCMQVK